MKTITFYSYKGGVGRSLALSNIAIKLSQLKKKVCIIDFDLDAPGLVFKFQNDFDLISNQSKKGLVDYIHEFSQSGLVPNSISEFSCVLKPKEVGFGNINLISAGDFENTQYWRKLSSINWSDLFYSKNAKGIRFFLDLKFKIEKELKPDFLLIDSRTGITDISGITLKLFADEVVVLAVNNIENKFGTKKIVETLLNSSSTDFNKELKINLILSRLPVPADAVDRAKESDLVNSWKSEFDSELFDQRVKFFIIHADRQLEQNERLKIGLPEKENSITFDYLRLFESLTFGSQMSRTDELDAIRRADKLFTKALNENDYGKKLNLLTDALALNGGRSEFLFERAKVFYATRQFKKAIEDFKQVLKSKPNDIEAKYYLAHIYHFDLRDSISAIKILDGINDDSYSLGLKGIIFSTIGRIDDALDCVNRGLMLDSSDVNMLNTRADIYRKIGEFDLGIMDIYKALEINPSVGVLFATLAELNLEKGNLNDFYLNLNVALSKNIDERQLREAKEVYLKVKNDPKFLQTLQRYQLDVNKIFEEI